jgi:hypothetical protein
MRKIKHLISIAFVLLTFIFIGDIYVWNIESFETPYISTTLYLNSGGTQAKMILDLERTSAENQCDIFVVNRDYINLYKQKVSIYGTTNVKEHLKNNSLISEGLYKSLVLGEITLEVQPLNKLKDIAKYNTFYIIGNMQDARIMKSQLIDQYGGNFPKEGYIYFNSKQTVFLLWMIGLFLFLLLTLYETALLKKELMIRIIYGDSLKSIIISKILYNWIAYLIIILSSYSILKYVLRLQVDFHQTITTQCLLLFGLFDALIYLRLFFTSYKSDISSRTNEKKILKISYLYKFVTSLLIVIIMSVSIEFIISGLLYYQQKDFFKSHRNFSYISLITENQSTEESDKKTIEIYMKQAKKGKSFSNVFLEQGHFTDRPCLLMDGGSISYLQSIFSEFQMPLKKNTIYFIVPAGEREGAIKDLNSLMKIYYKSNYEYKVIEYHKPKAVLGIYKPDQIVSNIYRNPLIIFNSNSDSFINYFNGIYLTFATMFQISSSEWDTYIEEYELDKNLSYISNVYENYLHSLEAYQRNILLGLTAFILLLLMDIILVKTTLGYECSIHAVEITIRTILGDTIFDKYKKIILTTMISSSCSTIGCIIMMILLNVSSLPYILVGCVVITFVELFFIVYYIKKIEKVNINKVLKGGHI